MITHKPQKTEWKIMSRELMLRSPERDQVFNVTTALQALLQDSGVTEGQATVFTPGATASVTALEFEPGLVTDLRVLLEEMIPFQRSWEHNRTWGDGNGGSHLRAALIGPSLTIPILAGQLALGTWQQVIVIDHDIQPRNRRVILQVVGQ